MAKTETTKPVDTWWSLLRWRIAVWLVYRALRIAPDGSAAISLEDHLGSWAAECRMQWHLRYPHPEAESNG